MSKKVLYLLGIALTILLGTWLQHSFCCTSCCEKEVQENEVSPVEVSEESQIVETTTSNFGFNFNSDTDSFKTNDNFSFLTSDFNLLLPISDSINLGIEKLKSSLSDSNSKFKINGLYNSSEENNSIFPDLGIARATAVKNYLISKGISENKIAVSSSLSDDLSKVGDTITNSISYELISLNTTTEN